MKWFRHNYGPIDDFSVGQDEHWFAFRIPPLKWGIALHIMTRHYGKHAVWHYESMGKSPPEPKRKVYVTWTNKDPRVQNIRVLWKEK